MSFNILLVDDDKEFREEFSAYLEEYTVYQAASGLQALNILRRPNVVDLVVLDIMMPGLNGIKVLREIRDIALDLPIIILTGYSSKDTAIQALKANADDYLEKPIDIEKTKSIIKNLLTKKVEGFDLNIADTQDKIEMAKSFLKRNYDKNVSLKDVAYEVALSPKYLSRIFREYTGVGFGEYKIGIRIKKAKEMLLRTGYSIEQISDRLGYQNTESFIRIFKKNIKETPTQYRNKIKRVR
jgi:YesN/AraC family two-component response regulator